MVRRSRIAVDLFDQPEETFPVGLVEVAAVDPMASMLAVDNEVLLEIAKDIKEKLSKVIKKLSNYSNSHFYL